MWFRSLLVGAFVLLASCTGSRVRAQQPVIPNTNVITTLASSTVAATGTFQSVFAAPTGAQKRQACTVQNKGSNAMYVYTGTLANATQAQSVQLSPGQAYFCNNGLITVQEQVSVTGTSGDAFYAAQQ